MTCWYDLLDMPSWAMGRAVDLPASLGQLGATIAQRKAASTRRGISLRLDELTRLFSTYSF